MPTATDYKFNGYGILSRGSSVKMFMGTDQQLFLGGKNNVTVGLSNTFTAGIKSDVMLGPAISMGIAFKNWDKDAVGYQSGHLTAKYDFSTNKNFAFQIAPEGSSNYVVQSKFNCDTGFQAVAGYQTIHENLYDTYKEVLAKMGLLLAITNIVSSFVVIANTLEAPAPPDEKDKGELKDDMPRQYLGAAAAWAATSASTGAAMYAAIRAAIQRETSFKPWIHPQSVIDLKKEHVFLGAIGDTKTKLSGASLLLKDGKATLGARKYLVPNTFPFLDKNFNDFVRAPTTSLVIDPTSIAGSAKHVIHIEAGGQGSVDPKKKSEEQSKGSAKKLEDARTKAGLAAYDLALKTPGLDATALQTQAKAAQKRVEASLEPGIQAAKAAETTAETFYRANPSLYLSAGSKTGGKLSKIEATAPFFNVISNSISLSPDTLLAVGTPNPLRGVFVKTTAGTNTIKLIQGPKTHEILMDPQGTTLKFGFSEIQLKPNEIVIKNGTGIISVTPSLVTIGAGPQQVKIGQGIVQAGRALKVIG